MIFINIIVLIFEILYYSMFMKFARKDGKFWKYLLLFTLVTIVTGIANINSLFSYIVIVSSILFGLKYIVKVKTTLYDMFFILVMIFFKLFIELIIYLIFIRIVNYKFLYILYQLSKIFFSFILKNKINVFYKKIKILWNNNNFYIRYLFSISMFLYFIFSMIYIIVFR